MVTDAEKIGEIMKIKKRVAIFTAAAIILNTAAFAAELDDRYYLYMPQEISGEIDFTYSPYDTAEFYKYISEIKTALAQPGQDDFIRERLENIYNEYLKSVDTYYMAVLEADKHFNVENSAAVTSEYSTNSELYEKFTEVLIDLVDSDYAYILRDILGYEMTEEEIEEYIKSAPTEEDLALEQQENELVQQYSGIYGDSEKSADLYLQLLDVRKQIAEKAGFQSYTDYINQSVYGRDYSSEEITEFQNAVAEYISPYFTDAMAAYYLSNMAVPEADMETVRDRIGDIMGKIDPELEETYDYMVSNDLYDFEYSADKNPAFSGYTVSFPYLKLPYIVTNPYTNYGSDYIDNAITIIHEFGHFSSILHDPINEEKYSALLQWQSVDTSEVQSQGLEVLAEKYFGELFGSGASGARYNAFLNRVSTMLDGCIFTEFETKAYELENPTVQELNKIAAEAMSKYYCTEVDEESAMSAWTTVSHIFQSPLYYLSYAVSSAAACELYAMSIDDYDYAVDRYMRLSSLGQSVPFKVALGMCGIENPIDDEAIKEISDIMGEKYALGYEDVKAESWYYPYILYTSHVFEAVDIKHFEPDVNITRGDFVKLLGRAEDFYYGIETDSDLIFDDVSAYSDEAVYISWAYDNGIITGVSDTIFDGDAPITREQLVAIMYRYAEYKGENTDVDKKLADDFYDCDDISDWAELPVSWAVENSIVNGKDNNMFDPLGTATRAESSKIMTMFIENYY